MRKKKSKVESEVENWLSKYDQDMSEKQVEIDELMVRNFDLVAVDLNSRPFTMTKKVNWTTLKLDLISFTLNMKRFFKSRVPRRKRNRLDYE